MDPADDQPGMHARLEIEQIAARDNAGREYPVERFLEQRSSGNARERQRPMEPAEGRSPVALPRRFGTLAYLDGLPMRKKRAELAFARWQQQQPPTPADMGI